MEVLAFLRGPLRYAERLVGHDATLRALARWRVWLYDCLTPRVPAALAGWRSGDLLTRAIDDVDTLQDLYLRTLLPLAVALGSAALGLVVVGVILPVAALALGVPLAVACTVPPFLAWRGGGRRRGGRAGRRTLGPGRRRHSRGARPAGLRRRRRRARPARDAERTGRRPGPPAGPGQRPGHLAHPGLPGCGASWPSWRWRSSAVHAHHLNPVMVAVLPLAALATFEPMPGIAQAAARARTVSAAARRLLALEAVPVPVTDPLEADHLPGGVPDISLLAAPPCATRPTCPAPSTRSRLTVAPGARLAVTGSSGAGKSSLVSALLRFWPLEEGALSVGGVPVTRLSQSDVRAACALVDQRAQLFAGTVRSNVTLGRPDATDARGGSRPRGGPARATGWPHFPSGLETPVGDDGVTVSGGERRRLAVARALLAGGPVLVLDEPTAGLDAPLADQLIDDVLAAAGERSVLLITHRAGEAARCDAVVTLEGGRVVP